MYEQRLGTEWDTLEDRTEVLARAYALGVADRIGTTPEGELDRLVDCVTSGYDRNLVSLAYEEGRTDAAKANRTQPEAVWEALVEDSSEETPEGSRSTIPRAIQPPQRDSRPADSTASVRLPSFLTGGDDQ